MNARTFLLIVLLLAGSTLAVSAFRRDEPWWSRVQCAVLAVASYIGVIVAWLALGA